MAGEAMLIVDDNPANLKLARVVLSGAGYEVRTAADAEEALVALETFRPRLILMDIQLPGMDGLELTRRLKADPRSQGIVILALTAYAMKGDEEKAREAGCDGYIVKPIDTRTLPAVIARSLLGGQPAMKAESILLVEDNPITRKMLRFTLESEGYELMEAGDGREALAAARQRRPDLVVLDYALPDTDGQALLARLREELASPLLPAIVVTGMVSRLDDLRAGGGVATQFVAKPVEPSRLLDLVAAHFAAPRVAAAAGHRVLVVDDEPLNRKLTTIRLAQMGYQVDSVGLSTEAVELARRQAPDAVVADVLMPGIDGFTLCRTLRGDPALAHIPVVLVSAAYVEAPDRELAGKVGAHALVLRTPDLHEVVDALESALRGQVAPPPLASGAQVDALHDERLRVQLERQMARNEVLLRQAAIQATALSIIRGLSEVLAQPADATEILGDVLVHCLDAAGLSTGMLYVVEGGGRHRLQAQFGSHPRSGRRRKPASAIRRSWTRWWKAASRWRLQRRRGTWPRPTCCGGSATRPVLVVPFIVLGQGFGELLLASDAQDLAQSAWIGFARTLSLQFGQTVALGQSLKRVAASESRYRALMEQANDAILVLDTDTRVLEANIRAEQLLRRTRAELVGHAYDELVAPEEQTDSARRHQELLRQGTLRVEGRRLLRPDGSVVLVEVSAALAKVGLAVRHPDHPARHQRPRAGGGGAVRRPGAAPSRRHLQPRGALRPEGSAGRSSCWDGSARTWSACWDTRWPKPCCRTGGSTASIPTSGSVYCTSWRRCS